jgi:peptidyl-prolyl cis-trans isomerase C
MTTPASSPGCSVRPAITGKQTPVSVNGVVIARAAISRETQNHPAAKPIEAWLAAARALVVRELLLQEAKRLAIVPEPIEDDEGRCETDDEALIRMVIAREVVTPDADEAACQRYYEMNRRRFRSPDLYEARHILIAANPSDTAARQAARQRAEAIITALRQAPSAFADMALAESACPSGKTGGNLGQIGPGQTVPEFEKALATLQVGDISTAPIETRYGFHIVMLERRIDGRELPFDMVRARIAAWLGEKVRRTAIRQYIAILAGRAEITGIALDSSASPLVQ